MNKSETYDEKHNPLVSIAIPTYNGSRYLSLALDSLMSQTFKNFEIIISDNASTDDTAKIAEVCSKMDTRIKYIKRSHTISAIENFNISLTHARGKYFMWAADDDLWDKEFLAYAVEEFEKHKEENILLVSPRFYVIDANGERNLRKKNSFINFSRNYLDLKSYLKEDFYGFKANIFYGLYKKDILLKIGGYSTLPALAASDILTLHTIMSHGKVLLLDKVLFYKREIFFHDRFDNNKLSIISLWLHLVKTTYNIIVVTLQNFYPSNFRYLMNNVNIYYSYNNVLINKFHKNDIYRLRFYNILSSFQLLLVLFPNDVQSLKKRNQLFSGKDFFSKK
jgi:glycosyltransferase involved in cell wall biosynthesis